MQPERIITEEEAALYQKRAERTADSLKKRGIDARFAATRAEALAAVMELIPEGTSVGTADSLTLHEVGVIEAIGKRGRNPLINPFARDAAGNRIYSDEQREELKRQVFSCDVYVIGSNAVTLDGKLVNTDAGGNRVAAMIYGPRKVIVVMGANKIVKDAEAALRRIREVAAPQNALRIGLKHHSAVHMELPCTQTGLCHDCNHPKRICRYTTIIEGVSAEHRGRITVILVGERLGI